MADTMVVIYEKLTGNRIEWVNNPDIPQGYTTLVPPSSEYVWDETGQQWVLSPILQELINTLIEKKVITREDIPSFK